ncbi:MSHA biogenesis protein MshE, partial [Photobacterium damselae subsp. damselae]|nr:MSHA biogenesis protein MshE [Photobacterium damselae subsp. damselae]
SQHTFHYGRGCQNCNFSGYRGRIGVFELLEIDMPMMDALRDNNAVLFGQLARNSQSYKPLIESAMELAMAGTTSIDEVLILGESDNIDLVV